MEGIFWAGIIIWAFVLLYLYVHVLSLKKTGMVEIQEMIASKDARQETSQQRNDPMPSFASERNGSSPERSSQEPSQNVVSVLLERHTGLKGLSFQDSSARHAPGKTKVVGNRKSNLYHTPGMKYYHKVKSQNRVIFNSETQAIKAGYLKAPE
jgi:hypothetical protein